MTDVPVPVPAAPARDTLGQENAAPVPETKPAGQDSMKTLLKKAQESLEVHIAGRECTVTLRERKITLKRWGLQKKLTLGAKTLTLSETIAVFLGDEIKASGEIAPSLLLQILGQCATTVLDVVSQSISSPFKSVDEAHAWLDEVCEPTDLIDLALVVFHQNFGGEEDNPFGGFRAQIDQISKRIQSLSQR